MKKFLYYAPRILAILYILFLALFALDVLTPGAPILSMLGGFLIHLLPNFILIIILLIAWKNEKLGGILFIIFALVLYLLLRNPFFVNLILLTPPVVIGILFLMSGKKNQN